MKANALMVAAFCLCVKGTAYAAGPVKILQVQVGCAGEDQIGSQLCYAVKEKIRASQGFELIDSDTRIPGTLKLSLITIEVDPDDTASAISAVILEINKDGAILCLGQYVYICGYQRIDYIANGMIADIDHYAELIRKYSRIVKTAH